MNPDLYRTAAKGEIEPFNEIAKDELVSIVTHDKNTVLHVNIACQKEGERVSTEFVERILEICPSLLLQVNEKGDTPLHVAAKCRHPAVVEVLIKFAKKQSRDLESGVDSVSWMLSMENEEKHTALHEAVQSGSLDTVKILLKEGPDYTYLAYGGEQTPLYMAAAKGSVEIVAEILENCPSADHRGPDGLTALHAAVICNAEGVIKLLLKKKKILTRERDLHGWTPLHHAAYLGYSRVVSRLIKSDEKFVVLSKEDDRGMTALHLAASQGHERVARSIITRCPESLSSVDNRGWNALHFAVVSLRGRVLKSLVGNPFINGGFMSLMRRKDKNGNTPLHVLAAVYRDSSYFIVPDCYEYDAVNKQNTTVEHIARYGSPELEKEIKDLSKDVGTGGQYSRGLLFVRTQDPDDVLKMEDSSDYRKFKESHLVVAALIATVAFAAAFTIPGGYKSDNGTAILRGNTSFQAFIITDTIAMVFSLIAVFIYFYLSFQLDWKVALILSVVGFFSTMISMGAIVIAFVTGTYAMLAPSLGLAIVTCVIGLTFLLFSLSVIRSPVSSVF